MVTWWKQTQKMVEIHVEKSSSLQPRGNFTNSPKYIDYMVIMVQHQEPETPQKKQCWRLVHR